MTYKKTCDSCGKEMANILKNDCLGLYGIIRDEHVDVDFCSYACLQKHIIKKIIEEDREENSRNERRKKHGSKPKT